MITEENWRQEFEKAKNESESYRVMLDESMEQNATLLEMLDSTQRDLFDALRKIEKLTDEAMLDLRDTLP